MLKKILIFGICYFSIMAHGNDALTESFDQFLSSCKEADQKVFFSMLDSVENDIYQHSQLMTKSELNKALSASANDDELSTLEWIYHTLGEPYSNAQVLCWEHLYEVEKMYEKGNSQASIRDALTSWKSCQYSVFRPAKSNTDMSVVDCIHECFSFHNQ